MTDPTPEPAPEPEGQLYRMSFVAEGVVDQGTAETPPPNEGEAS
jgi:hypothetical protein